MTQKLILFFNSDLINGGIHSGFATLSSEFGLEHIEEIYQLLVERLLTESFPVDNSYEIILASDHEPSRLHSWLGSNWEHIDLRSIAAKGQFQHMLCSVFESPSVEKVLILRVGTLGVDEDQIKKTFQGIDKDNLSYQFGTDGHLVSLGIHRDQMNIMENLDFGEEHLGDLIAIRAEHYGIDCHVKDPYLIPSSLEELTAFRENLPKEHFIATKIDQLVLGTLEPDNIEELTMDNMRTIQIDLSPDEEQEES